MRTIVLDGAEMTSRQSMHDHLARRLELPDYYGRNLDALYDVFTGELHDVRIFFRGESVAEENLGGYFSMFKTMCQEASEQNPELEIFFQ